MSATLYRDAAVADGRSPDLRLGVSVLTEDGRITWICDSGDEGPVPGDAQVIDAGGTTGLEPWEALASITWRGGELLGEPDAGVIREGGPADFSLVHGDPLSDPTALWRVWRVAP